jgi:hypothetical protein
MICETAFGYKDETSVCFLSDGFSRWGWTTPITPESTSTLNLYAGAAGCSTDEGNLAGTVLVEYYGGTVTLTYTLLEGFTMTDVHAYVGSTKYPTFKSGKKTVTTVAPGQYPYVATGLNNETTHVVTFTNKSGNLWVIAHAVTCYLDVPDQTVYDLSKSAEIAIPVVENGDVLRAYPNPFSNKVYFEFVSGRDAHAILEISNMIGQKVSTLFEGQISRNVTNRVEFEPIEKVSGMYFYRLNIDGNIQTGKVLYKK